MSTVRAVAARPAVGPRGSLADAVLRPVRGGNAFESTVEQLATAIRLGVFAEGEWLPPERELADRLRVGRATLREAIGALRAAGLVRTHRGRTGGIVVLDCGATETQAGAAGPGLASGVAPAPADVLAYRAVVEPGAAWSAARADLTAEQRSWLREALAAAAEPADPGARRVADSRLHLAIAALSGSSLLVEAVARARALTVHLLAAIPVLPANIAHSDRQHAEIVDAVLAGDPARARAAMEHHCEATAALLRALLD